MIRRGRNEENEDSDGIDYIPSRLSKMSKNMGNTRLRASALERRDASTVRSVGWSFSPTASPGKPTSDRKSIEQRALLQLSSAEDVDDVQNFYSDKLDTDSDHSPNMLAHKSDRLSAVSLFPQFRFDRRLGASSESTAVASSLTRQGRRSYADEGSDASELDISNNGSRLFPSAGSQIDLNSEDTDEQDEITTARKWKQLVGKRLSDSVGNIKEKTTLLASSSGWETAKPKAIDNDSSAPSDSFEVDEFSLDKKEGLESSLSLSSSQLQSCEKQPYQEHSDSTIANATDPSPQRFIDNFGDEAGSGDVKNAESVGEKEKEDTIEALSTKDAPVAISLLRVSVTHRGSDKTITTTIPSEDGEMKANQTDHEGAQATALDANDPDNSSVGTNKETLCSSPPAETKQGSMTTIGSAIEGSISSSGRPPLPPKPVMASHGPTHDSTHSNNIPATDRRDESETTSSVLENVLPLSEFARATGVVFEGWLEKKSSISGMWVQRYYVLEESSEHFCTLKVFNRAVLTAWGTVPTQLKTVIPIASIDVISTESRRAAKGREFSLSLNAEPAKTKKISSMSQFASRLFGGKQKQDQGSSSAAAAGDDSASISSDFFSGGGKGKVSKLRAQSAENRFLWTKVLQQVLELACESRGQ